MAGIVPRDEMLELTGYIKSMSTRLQSLQAIADQFAKQINQLTSGVKTRKSSLVGELESIREDIISIKQEVRSAQKAILEVINQLKGSVKAEDLERFKKRMDIWSPEKLVTRREVERVLKDINLKDIN